MKSATCILLTLFMVGCGKTKQAEKPQPREDPFALLNFNLRYITVLNHDTAAISRCTVEEMKIGNDRGPICQAACETADLLIKFEQENQALMLRTKDKPSKQHEWCKDSKKIAEAR